MVPNFLHQAASVQLPPLFPPKAWEEKAKAREGRARALSHLTRQQ